MLRNVCFPCRTFSLKSYRFGYRHYSWRDAEKAVVVDFSDGKELRLSSGKLARFADGSCVASLGDTNVLVTAVGKQKPSFSSFVALTVDYHRKSAAAGRIPTNHLRRDFGQNEQDILTSRVIDRSLRPRFPRGVAYEAQVICNLLSVDGVHDPDVVSINAASSALSLSGIPWIGPVGAVRVGYIDNEVVVNPTRKDLALSSANFIVTGTDEMRAVMIEGCASKPIPVSDLTKMIITALKEVKIVIKGIKELASMAGKETKIQEKCFVPTQEQIEATKLVSEAHIKEILTNYSHDKISRDEALSNVRQSVLEKLKENFPNADPPILLEAINDVSKDLYKDLVFTTGLRCDGRKASDLRNISCSVNLYNSLHGSALFQRGQTQVLCTLTLDSIDSSFRADPLAEIMGELKEKNFMLHYDFPPYATNETGRTGVFGRREIGHGALAEKGLRAVVPKNFPFTIRLGCEVLESNGSSSMASVCAGSLALLDAGVSISEPAAGIAIGMLSQRVEQAEEKYEILTDILGIEDYWGDMDFKIAGTKSGITAMQLDVKIAEGLSLQMLKDSLVAATKAQANILSIMNSVIETPNKNKTHVWPVMRKLAVPPHKRAKLIGIGGYNLKKLTSETGVRISQDPEDMGGFILFAPNKAAMEEGNEFIENLLRDEIPEPSLDFGAIYTTKIVEIRDNGVMLELHPRMPPAFLRNKELDQRSVGHPSALGLKVGQEIQVKYFGRDPVSGHLRLSRRVLQLTAPKAKNFVSEDA